MITVKPLLSENAINFMDYALEVIKSMDGAPDHSPEAQVLVNEKLTKLRAYLEVVSQSYHETVPQIDKATGIDGSTSFSGTGHS